MDRRACWAAVRGVAKSWHDLAQAQAPASVVFLTCVSSYVLVFGMEERSFSTVCLLFIPMWTSEFFQWTLISSSYLKKFFMLKLSQVWSVSPALGCFLCLFNIFPPLDHS